MTAIWLLVWLGVALIVAALFGAVANKASRDRDPASREVKRIRKAGF